MNIEEAKANIGAEDDNCQIDLWEIKGEDNVLECASCGEEIIINADDQHEYTDEWTRYDYEDKNYSLWSRDCKHCDDSEIIETAYKADLPSYFGEKE